RLTRDGRDIRYAAEGHASGLNLRRIGGSFGIGALNAQRYESDVAGDFGISGAGTSVDTLALDATGMLIESEVLGANIPRMTFEGHLHDGDLQVRAQGQFSGFNPAVLRGPQQAGSQRIPEGNLSGTLDIGLGIREVTGAGVVPDSSRAGRASAFIDRLSLDGRIALAKSRVAGLDLDQASVAGTYRDRVTRLDAFDLKNRTLQANASGTVALNETDQSDLQYSLDTQDVSVLASMVDLPLSGTVHASGRVAGNATELVTSDQLKGTDVRYADYRAASLGSRYDVRVPELAADRLAVKADSHAGLAVIADHTIADIKAVTTYAENALGFDATIADSGREIQSKGSLTLHPDHRQVVLRSFSVASEDAHWSLAPDARTTIRYGIDRLEVDRLKLVGPVDPVGDAQRLDVDGALGSGRLGLKIDANNVDLAPIDSLLLLERQLQGRLTASAIVTGTTEHPLFEGGFSLLNGGIRGYTFQSARAALHSDANVLILDGQLDQVPGAGVTVRGRLPLALFGKATTDAAAGEHVAGGPQMDLRLQSPRVDLAVLQAFTPRLSNTTGSASLDVRLQGTPRDPHLIGLIELIDGGFTVVPTAVAYHGAQVRLNFEPDRVRLERFELVDEHNHRLRLAGELAVHEGTVGDLNLQVEGQQFEIIDNDLADIKLDTLLEIGGDLRRPRIRGQVELTRGQVSVDELLKLARRPQAWQPPPDPFDFSTLPEAVSTSRPMASPVAKPSTSPGQVVVGAPRVAQPEKTTRPEAGPPPPLTAAALFRNVEADIRFTMPNNLVLRGTELESEGSLVGLGEIAAMVGGDVTIRKAAGEGPRLRGSINTVRGTYSFQGRRFELLRGGVIRFVGLEEIDPILNITAQREISGVVAQVHIGGTLRSPELTLSSQPPLDQTDILSLIAFNQPVNELGAGQAVSLAEQAAGLATGFAAARLTRELSRALELDILDIQPPASFDGGPSVTVGQRMTPSTFLKVTQRFGPASSTEVGIEQQLTEFMRLDAKGAQGLATTRQIFRRVERAGADLVFFFSY
ncbi:MAG: translocation/assembly module TamB, partial [Acidobacteria bacterium]|nr:translocation/assembly module TamB [Acidobacteriota bacterium]